VTTSFHARLKVQYLCRDTTPALKLELLSGWLFTQGAGGNHAPALILQTNTAAVMLLRYKHAGKQS
jgi:hypothetical protein